MLSVLEIFHSIEGETTRTGFSSHFVRLAGCNLNCRWCDTPTSHDEGTAMEVHEVLKVLHTMKPAHHVTITGGEPLLQKGIYTLIEALLDNKRTIQVETNGSLDISRIPEGIRKIVDVKTPSSGEENSFLLHNLGFLSGDDEMKFIIQDKEDFEFTLRFLERYVPPPAPVINVTPAYNIMEPALLAEMIRESGAPLRLNMQLHKYIGIP